MENLKNELETTMQRIMEANSLYGVTIEVTKVKTEPVEYEITINDEVIKRSAKASVIISNTKMEKQEIHALAQELVERYLLSMGTCIHQEILDSKHEIMPFLANEKIRKEVEGAIQNEIADKKIPYHTVCDIEIMYGKITKDGNMLPITNFTLEELGLTMEQVRVIAFENMRKQGILLTPVYMDVYAQMAQQLTSKEEKEELLKSLMQMEQEASHRMTLVRTKTGHGGNAFIVDSEALKQIYQLYEEEYYLIPAGTDSCIIMSKASEMPLPVMKNMVEDMHRDISMMKLSDHVYAYSKTNGLQIAI